MLEAGPFRSTIAARSAEDEQYPAATVWAKQGQQPDAMRDYRFLAGNLGTATPYLVHADGQSPPVVQIIYPASHNAARAGACVLALAVCLYFVRRASLFAWLAIAAAVALMLPERFAPWPRAAYGALRWRSPGNGWHRHYGRHGAR